jgi:hypothetical protein
MEVSGDEVVERIVACGYPVSGVIETDGETIDAFGDFFSES